MHRERESVENLTERARARERTDRQTETEKERKGQRARKKQREHVRVCASSACSRISLHTCETDRYSAILSVISVLEGAEYKINLVDNSLHAVT